MIGLIVLVHVNEVNDNTITYTGQQLKQQYEESPQWFNEHYEEAYTEEEYIVMKMIEAINA